MNGRVLRFAALILVVAPLALLAAALTDFCLPMFMHDAQHAGGAGAR